jgi:hypothetical protein
MEMDGYGMLSSLFYMLISLVGLARCVQKFDPNACSDTTG